MFNEWNQTKVCLQEVCDIKLHFMKDNSARSGCVVHGTH